MASEEERSKIMSEYMDSLNKSDDDDSECEEALNYLDNDNEHEDQNEKFDQESQSDYAVLNGSLSLSDEGRLLYTGSWTMNSNLEKQKASTGGSSEIPPPQIPAMGQRKKKTKFKLKSKSSLPENFLTLPLFKSKPQTLLLDGFFTTDETDRVQPFRKIKERDIELSFAAEVVNIKTCIPTSYTVQGRGTNEFGPFTISGIYTPTKSENNKNPTPSSSHSLVCHKRYISVEPQSARKRRRVRDDDDDDISDDGGADFNEVIGLHEDANLSVEELRRKYYGSGTMDGNNEDKGGLTFGHDDTCGDADDGCGF